MRCILIVTRPQTIVNYRLDAETPNAITFIAYRIIKAEAYTISVHDIRFLLNFSSSLYVFLYSSFRSLIPLYIFLTEHLLPILIKITPAIHESLHCEFIHCTKRSVVDWRWCTKHRKTRAFWVDATKTFIALSSFTWKLNPSETDEN